MLGSNYELSDQELIHLMKDVLVDIKKRAKIAAETFKKRQKEAI
jgi:hypothetical protein